MPTMRSALLLLCRKHALNTDHSQLLNPTLGYLGNAYIYTSYCTTPPPRPLFIYFSLPLSQSNLFSSLCDVGFLTYHTTLPNLVNSYLYSKHAPALTHNSNTTTNTKDPRIRSHLSYENCLSFPLTPNIFVLFACSAFPQE